MSEVDTPAPKSRPVGAILALAAVAGVLLGVGGLYGMGAFERNASGAATAACAAAPDTARRLDPLVKGEIAALVPARTPLSLADIPFRRPDGSPVSLGDFKGRVVLLNLWATWCAPCRKEMPGLDRLQAKLGGPAFEVVAVNIDTREPEKAARFLDEIGVKSLARYADPTLGVFQTLKTRGRALGMPTTVLIDRAGCELGTMNGPAEWDTPDALRLIEAAIAGREVRR